MDNPDFRDPLFKKHATEVSLLGGPCFLIGGWDYCVELCCVVHCDALCVVLCLCCVLCVVVVEVVWVVDCELWVVGRVLCVVAVVVIVVGSSSDILQPSPDRSGKISSLD